MAASQFIQHLRRVVLLQDGSGLTDGQLLGCFLERRDETAFAALVQRHARMVWGVCRRLLSHHDAEDAFQATFLVLGRKAGSIVPKEMVANWLYGVAHQTALQARRTVARRRAREKQVTQMPEPAVVERDVVSDLQPLLDQELSRLPDYYRAVVVLCDLEGKTRKEAARQLGLPEGTVGSRLARARTMLAQRLARHGLALSGGALVGMLAQSAAAAVPGAVLRVMLEATPGAISAEAVALAAGVIKAMSMTKLKIGAGIFFLLVLLGAGPAVWTCHGQPAPATAGAQRRPAEPVAVAEEQDEERDRGKWEVDLNEVHRNPAYKNMCALCHQMVRDIDRLLVRQKGDIAILRLPKKDDPAGQAEFLRRVCLDFLGRTPTPLEMHYYLKDSDPEKSRKVVEMLLKQSGSHFAVIQLNRLADQGARAEEYVKEQLHKKKLTPAERELLQKVLEFTAKEPAAPGRAELEQLWREHFSEPGMRGPTQPSQPRKVP